MQVRRTAALVVAGGVLVLGLTACGDDEDVAASEQTPRPTVTPSRLEVAEDIDQEAPQIVNVTVTGDGVSGDSGVVEVRLNSPVQLIVLADTQDMVVVEGYGFDFRTEPGRPVIFDFVADRAGTFEVRLRESGLLLTTLSVEQDVA